MQQFNSSGRYDYIISRIEESIQNIFGSRVKFSSLKQDEKTQVVGSLKICNSCESLILADEKVCWDCGSEDIYSDSARILNVIEKLEY